MSVTLTKIPTGYKIVSQDGKQALIEKIKSSRRKFKLSAKTRAKISAAAKKTKWPVATILVNTIPIVQTVGWAFDKVEGPTGGWHWTNKAAGLFNAAVTPYVGVKFVHGGQGVIAPSFDSSEMYKGLLPNAILLGAKYLAPGVFRRINKLVSRMKLPISIS